MTIPAPFIWFGGKRRVADLVWAALGNVDNYIEPFFGSGAVLLGRPEWHMAERRTETINDRDAYVCNVWRALAAAPDEVAKYADWPVNETDLLARHIWLVNEGRRRIDKLEADPEYFDVKVAGWWLWGINIWIGSGWCEGNGPWGVVDGTVKKNGGEGGQWRQRIHLGDAGRGVNRKLPHLGTAGQGVNRQRPHIARGGMGVNRKGLGDLAVYFESIANRLRHVRVCCGDWSRIVTDGAMSDGKTVGVFLDPPYSHEVRESALYRIEDTDVAAECRDWAIANGEDRRLRIILAGYAAEHESVMPPTWRMHRYSASKAYGTTAAVGSGVGNDANRHNEALWFSPGCLAEPSLFEITPKAPPAPGPMIFP